MKTVSIQEYLKSANGMKFIDLLKEHKDRLAGRRCGSKYNARDYLLAEEAYVLCLETIPNSYYLDFDVDKRIMDCDPVEVFNGVKGWMDSEYALDILSSNDERYEEEVKSMFGDFLPPEE